MCKDNWIELNNIEDVARAKVKKWEIQYHGELDWIPWRATSWINCIKYRGRPKQPKKVTVTSEY